MAASISFSLVTSTPLFFTTTSHLVNPVLSRRLIYTLLARSMIHTKYSKSVSRTSVSISSSVVPRRSGNYKPSIWDNDAFLQSLHNPYTGGVYAEKARKLVGMVRMMLADEDESFSRRLELVDSLERLGLAYHFTSEIKDVLDHIFNDTSNDGGDTNGSLHTTALKFRLFRHHGYDVSPDIFCSFKDNNGEFKESIRNDTKSMLSLYEASFYGMEGESIMDEAMDLSSKYLKDAAKKLDDPNFTTEVNRALEVPLRWKVDRLDARWCIEEFARRGDTNPLVIEFAKLDYNIVQAMYQDEIKEVSRWWKNSNLGVKVCFSRNKLVSSYLWGIGVAGQPQFANGRKMVAKSISILSVMDDMYDIYGTLDELELFTEVVERWDINGMKNLPEYMKICFLALFNFVNEIAFDVLKEEQGCDIVSYLKNAWVVQLKAYLLEAKWYYTKHTPKMEEYLNNGWVSIGVPLVIAMCYAVETKPKLDKEMECLASHPDILRLLSMIVRLEDDLGTSTNELARGDVVKSIQCYMIETGASEEAARQHIQKLSKETWKKIKKCLKEEVSLPHSIVEFMINFGKVSYFFYRKGDGHSVQDYTKELASALLFDPIPLHYNDA